MLVERLRPGGVFIWIPMAPSRSWGPGELSLETAQTNPPERCVFKSGNFGVTGISLRSPGPWSRPSPPVPDRSRPPPARPQSPGLIHPSGWGEPTHFPASVLDQPPRPRIPAGTPSRVRPSNLPSPQSSPHQLRAAQQPVHRVDQLEAPLHPPLPDPPTPPPPNPGHCFGCSELGLCFGNERGSGAGGGAGSGLQPLTPGPLPGRTCVRGGCLSPTRGPAPGVLGSLLLASAPLDPLGGPPSPSRAGGTPCWPRRYLPRTERCAHGNKDRASSQQNGGGPGPGSPNGRSLSEEELVPGTGPPNPFPGPRFPAPRSAQRLPSSRPQGRLCWSLWAAPGPQSSRPRPPALEGAWEGTAPPGWGPGAGAAGSASDTPKLGRGRHTNEFPVQLHGECGGLCGEEATGETPPPCLGGPWEPWGFGPRREPPPQRAGARWGRADGGGGRDRV